MVLLLSLSLANHTFGQNCIKNSTLLHGVFPDLQIGNLTCTDTCRFPVIVNVSYAIKTTKPLVIGCRKTANIQGGSGFDMPLYPRSQFLVRTCKSTHEPITKKVSVEVKETKQGTLEALIADYVVDCKPRSK